MIEYLKVARVDHWLKNIFIVFGHAVAVVLVLNLQIDGSIVLKAVLSLIPACLIASANYILNEILDAPFDKLRARPLLNAGRFQTGLQLLPTRNERGTAVGC